MSLKELSEKLYPAFIEAFGSDKPCTLFLSASTLKDRAVVRHAVQNTPEQAWSAVMASLEKVFAGKEQPSILRVDWITSTVNMAWSDYLDKLKSGKRDWLRKGISFDKDYNLIFTEQELNANSIVYATGSESIKGEFQLKEVSAYCRQRFERGFPKMNRKDKVILFNTSAIFIQDGMAEPLRLIDKEDVAERRELNLDKPELFINMAKAATNYLVAQCQDDGSFVYGFYPCNDKVIKGYDVHHHLGTLFAMTEVYSVSEDGDNKKALGAAIERGLEYAINNCVAYRKTPDDENIAYFNDGKITTVGMSGLALLALSKWTTATGTKKYIPLMKATARSIFSLQKADGTFIHALNMKDFSVRKDAIVPSYDGEAIYGMLRLYAITKDNELIESCERILNRFIETEYWKNHDHWLSYAVNEFTLYRPEEKYFELGINNTLINAAADSSIRLEQIMATTKMIEHMKSLPEMKILLERVDEKEFYSIAKLCAEQLIDAYFFSEVAMYFKMPEHILNSFFARNDSFRVRIDDLQHGISGVLAYTEYLKGVQPIEEPPQVVKDIQTVEEPPQVVKDVQPIEESPQVVKDVQTKQMERRVIQMGSMRITIEAEQTEPTRPQAVAVDNPPLQVGIMKKSDNNFWEMSNPLYPMFCMAKHFNIELLFFAPEDIDFKNKTVKALTLENNSKVHKVAPLPQIIDNDIIYFNGNTSDLMTKLKKYSRLVRPISGIDKTLFYETLSNDKSFRNFLIETHYVNEFSQLLSLLDKYNDDIILKPATSSNNEDIARINFDNGKYVATFNDEVIILTSVNSLLKFYEENLSQKNYLVQPYCIPRTRQGNPFMIRLHIRRGAEGKVKVFPYPQIGSPKDFIPTIIHLMGFEEFLKMKFGKDWRMLRDKLMDLGYKFPEYYQSFLTDTIFDMGIDVCIQKRGDFYDLKIFEAHVQPNFANLRNEIAVTNFEYYRYLDEKIKEGSLE